MGHALSVTSFGEGVLTSCSLTRIRGVENGCRQTFRCRSCCNSGVSSVFSLGGTSSVRHLTCGCSSRTGMTGRGRDHEFLIRRLYCKKILFILIVTVVFRHVCERHQVTRLRCRRHVTRLGRRATLSRLRVRHLRTRVSTLGLSNVRHRRRVTLGRTRLYHIVSRGTHLHGYLFARASVFGHVRRLDDRTGPKRSKIGESPGILLVGRRRGLGNILFSVCSSCVQCLGSACPGVASSSYVCYYLGLYRFSSRAVTCYFNGMDERVITRQHLQLGGGVTRIG